MCSMNYNLTLGGQSELAGANYGGLVEVGYITIVYTMIRYITILSQLNIRCSHLRCSAVVLGFGAVVGSIWVPELHNLKRKLWIYLDRAIARNLTGVCSIIFAGLSHLKTWLLTRRNVLKCH